VSGWYALLAPAGTATPIIDQLNRALIRLLAMPDARQNLTSLGLEISPSSPEELASFIKSEMAKWSKAVKLSGAKAN
jgi:tripartite-type tricarboxylate transporter receptor subunit TctC